MERPFSLLVSKIHEKVTEFFVYPRQCFCPQMRTAIFSQSIKYYDTQKAHRKTKFCFSNQQSIGLHGASCYLCQYSLFSEPPAKKVTKKVKIC